MLAVILEYGTYRGIEMFSFNNIIFMIMSFLILIIVYLFTKLERIIKKDNLKQIMKSSNNKIIIYIDLDTINGKDDRHKIEVDEGTYSDIKSSQVSEIRIFINRADKNF